MYEQSILYADDELVVVNKPAGRLSVPGRLVSASLTTDLMGIFGDIHVVHRLDMATSGLMVFARNKSTLSFLHRAFAQRQVEKSYVAVCAGWLGVQEGEIALPLIADWPRRPRQKVDLLRGKPSLTQWQVLGYEGENTRLALFPHTGRSHQLRVHCQYLGHPILGDEWYADAASFRAASRLLLHAQKLTFCHPTLGWMTFEQAADF